MCIGQLLTSVPSCLFLALCTLQFDTAILDIRDVDLMAARFIGDVPVLVISSQIQYIYCVRDKNGQGDIVEGTRDDIRQESIFFVFRQDPTGETKDFEIVEMSFGGSARIT
jgi:Tim44-like domain